MADEQHKTERHEDQVQYGRCCKDEWR